MAMRIRGVIEEGFKHKNPASCLTYQVRGLHKDFLASKYYHNNHFHRTLYRELENGNHEIIGYFSHSKTAYNNDYTVVKISNHDIDGVNKEQYLHLAKQRVEVLGRLEKHIEAQRFCQKNLRALKIAVDGKDKNDDT